MDRVLIILSDIWEVVLIITVIFFTGLVRIAMTFGGKVRKFGEMGNILET
jgi:hypothetical protein